MQAEHERAMALLTREKASAAAAATAAHEKGRRVEAALQAVVQVCLGGKLGTCGMWHVTCQFNNAVLAANFRGMYGV